MTRARPAAAVRALAALALAALATLGAPASADAAKYSTGFYAEAGLGATGFLGQTGAYAAPGPAFGLRAGYDLFSWFSVGALLAGSTHEATVPPPPEREYFQLYHLAADGRLTVRYRRVAVFAEGALGLAILNTNVLEKVSVTDRDERSSIAFTGGGGIDYHTQNRHFSFGLAGGWTMYSGFAASQSVSIRLYLRYTY